MNILWCITGAGEYLKESIQVMSQLQHARITVFVSKAGEEVLIKYKLLRELKKLWPVEIEEDSAFKSAGKVTLGKFDAVVVSPATANTVAKIANGMADNLVSTSVSLALKMGLPVYVVPTDWLPKSVKIPSILTKGGSSVHMRPRKSDVRNLRYLEDEGVKLLETPKGLLKKL
jgi:dihydromethanopterin reductase (acceptor)